MAPKNVEATPTVARTRALFSPLGGGGRARDTTSLPDCVTTLRQCYALQPVVNSHVPLCVVRPGGGRAWMPCTQPSGTAHTSSTRVRRVRHLGERPQTSFRKASTTSLRVGGTAAPRKQGPAAHCNSGGGGPCEPLSGLLLSRGGGGGEGVLDPKLGVPKMARPDFPYCKFRFFPRWSLWSGEGGRGVWGEGSPPLGF